MAYVTRDTEWMNPVSDNIKQLITNFFTIGDNPDPQAGNQWADEVFVPEGRLVMGTQESAGEQGKSQSDERTQAMLTVWLKPFEAAGKQPGARSKHGSTSFNVFTLEEATERTSCSTENSPRPSAPVAKTSAYLSPPDSF
jgi:hypothetical protein